MLANKALILAFIYVIGAFIIFALIAYIKSLRKTKNTLTMELNNLRNRYNALQQDYKAYQYAQQKKEEANAQTQQALADVATASPNELANQLQHRKNRVRNKDSSSAI